MTLHPAVLWRATRAYSLPAVSVSLTGTAKFGADFTTSPALPATLGSLLLDVSALLLLQSLLRDLWLLHRQKRTASPSPARKLRCMCVESTLGVTGVAAGLVLLGAGADYTVDTNRWGWSFLALATMIVGFIVKDYVMEWNPWRIRRDREHLNIVFTWKA